MSTPYTILLSLPSLCQKNYQNRWKFDKVMTKSILTVFFETRCIQIISVVKIFHYRLNAENHMKLSIVFQKCFQTYSSCQIQ